MRRSVQSVLIVLVVLLAVPATALAGDTARYILPPGNYGGLPTTTNSLDQLPLYDALSKSQQISHVLARHEQGAFDVAGFHHLLMRLRANEPEVALPVFDRTQELARAGELESQVESLRHQQEALQRKIVALLVPLYWLLMSIAALRAVVQLVDVEGLSYSAAAAALGIPDGTLMSRLHRGRVAAGTIGDGTSSASRR